MNLFTYILIYQIDTINCWRHDLDDLAIKYDIMPGYYYIRKQNKLVMYIYQYFVKSLE